MKLFKCFCLVILVIAALIHTNNAQIAGGDGLLPSTCRRTTDCNIGFEAPNACECGEGNCCQFFSRNRGRCIKC